MKYFKGIKIILIIIILVLGAFLRFYDLDRQSYWMDEGYTINAVISGQENGFTLSGASILDSGKTYACQTYCLPTAGLTKVFGNNALSYRLLAAIFGFLFIFVIYFFAKIFFKDKKVALLPAFFVALSYWQIAWSREARWYTELEVFFWLALLFFYLLGVSFPRRRESSLFQKKTTTYLILSLVFTILAILTHKLAVLLPFTFLVWIFIKNFKIKNYLKIENWKLKILFLFLLILPLAITPNFFLNALHNINWSYNLPYYLSFCLRNYWPFILVGIYGFFSAEKEAKKKHLMLWSVFFIYLIPLSFLTNIVHYRYIFHLTPIFYLTAALSFLNIIPVKTGIQTSGLKHRIPACAGMTLIMIFFLAGEGIIFPQNFYFLESDDPAKLNRPYYAYTPQPDWNKAYDAIKLDSRLRGNDMIVISSHPHFNKIFLNQAGYWIRYDYLGFEKDLGQPLENNKEYYVNAEVINNLEELKKITAAKHGYLVFDYQSADGRISPEILGYIQKNLTLFFYNKINSYSQIWVYKF